MPDVFLNYVPDDREFGESLSDALEAGGLTIFRRDHAVGFGPTLTQHVDQQFNESACVVSLWSAASAGNAAFLALAQRAKHERRLLSVIVSAVAMPLAFHDAGVLTLDDWDGNHEHGTIQELRGRIRYFMERRRHRNSEPRDRETSEGPTQAARTVFLCYRRHDTEDAAGRLHDRLVTTYGADRVFIDIDSVPLGVNFVTHIEKQIHGCAAVLVMIGRGWTAITDAEGNRRLDDPADHVRVEVATALKQGVPVIPILVQNASMPRAADLPEDIRDLAFYNGIKLAPEFWRVAVEKLIKELDRVMKPSDGSREIG